MRLYTRGGDLGTTALIGGERRRKSDVRVEAYGTVDEAGAFLGLASSQLDEVQFADIRELLLTIQQRLWDVGADLAAPESAKSYVPRTPENAAAQLEPYIDTYQAEAEKLDKFVLRQGSQPAATLHVACTVVRRAERQAVRLAEMEQVPGAVMRYLNRLSDLLFVLARAVNARMQVQDVDYANSPPVFRDPRARRDRPQED
ncbi:ATP:cob(I)alamin adenosyltransferase [Alicyclobacillus sacchari]|uniref:Corrinoid adenosyltransferase n=1 Tax=Alicyclobacillus sacchari TaxID=392010 RepID=A0A4R8LR54_9BACL|nr:cob(I)yrinic acid a,c-diamide adenosyltransferase [Alicyclobacillus sacchari]TDY47965.1 ATP:cob(I)alamin adenosyltransferase [Alicyclobacillus sacchari]GMA56084.1 ATP--cob(I)alamin adenosyltransferase [Alicyclobacillus sacchari]